MKISKHNFPLIFIVNTKNYTETQLNFLYKFCDNHIKIKLNKLNTTQDKINSLCGNVLRKYLIYKIFGIEFEKQNLIFNKYK